jgi:hypothetical protein
MAIIHSLSPAPELKNQVSGVPPRRIRFQEREETFMGSHQAKTLINRTIFDILVLI